jgi:hypothetical protein
MNWFGISVGVATLFIIGLGFIWVIRGERHFGYLWWPYVMGAGTLFVVISMFITNHYVAALVGAWGASLLWGSTELKEQAVRGELGWYPFRADKIPPPFARIIRKWKAPSL